MLNRAFVAVVLLGIAVPVAAEPLAIPLSLYAAAAAADLHSTYRFLQYDGLHEGNPLVGWLETQPTTLVLVSAGIDVAALYSLHRWIGPNHPRIERLTLYAVAGVRVWATAHNYRNMDGRIRR